MNIGFFKKSKNGDLSGHLASMHLQGVVLEKVKKEGEGPDYRAHMEGSELGAAWNKTSEKGTDYISLEIDSPALPGKVYIALFATETAGEFVAAWNRKKPKAD